MNQPIDRRFLLRGAMALGAGALVAGPTGRGLFMPSPAEAATIEKRIAFRNVHTGEKIDARWYRAGSFDDDGLAEIDHGLRDWRTGAVARIDRDLIALLVSVRDRLDVAPRKPFDLISGYRSPHTNAGLRAKSGGVATKSQHMLGKATDIALPGVPLDRLRAAARAAAVGGVGYYPKDGFVHVDTGRVRFW